MLYFAPISDASAKKYIEAAWSRAQDTARRLGAPVEPIKPTHIYSAEDASNFGYSLALRDITPQIPDNAVLIIYGIYNADEYFDYIVLVDSRGRTHELFVEPVAYYAEKTGIWLGDPIILNNRSVIRPHTTSGDESKDRVYGWLLGYAVVPKSQPQPVEEPRPRRRRR